jgi:hypothetical protein
VDQHVIEGRVLAGGLRQVGQHLPYRPVGDEVSGGLVEGQIAGVQSVEPQTPGSQQEGYPGEEAESASTADASGLHVFSAHPHAGQDHVIL